MDKARLQPVLLGGLMTGVLSALPLVNVGNCCCCLWYIAGGVLAVYLRQQALAFQIAASEGALVGMFAGLVGGVIASILSIPLEMMMGPFQRQIMERMMSGNPDMPPEAREMMERLAMGGAAKAFQLVVNIVCGVIFGLLGGLLGVAIFKKTTPPPPGTTEVLPPA